MKINKIVIPILLSGLLLTGCEKPEKSEIITDNVRIEYKDYEPSHYERKYSSYKKRFVRKYVSDKYTVRVKYKDNTGYFYDRVNYNLVKNKSIGQTIRAVISKDTYKDGTVSYRIKYLK